MEDWVDRYEIVVEVKRADKKEPEIVSISGKKNGKEMDNRHGIEDKPCFGQKGPFNTDTELVDGCVGLGVTYDNRCRWLWGTWL